MSLIKSGLQQKRKSGVFILQDNHDKFAKQFRHMDTRVAVGIHETAPPHPNSREKLTLGELAIILEFGRPSFLPGGRGSIPARPFVSATVDKHKKKYGNLLVNALKKYGASFKATKSGAIKVADPKLLKGALNGIGLIAVRDMQQYMTDLMEPENAPDTIKRKGFNNPLIETGHLRQNIKHSLEDKKGRAKRK